jgi:hypothetical protein
MPPENSRRQRDTPGSNKTELASEFPLEERSDENLRGERKCGAVIEHVGIEDISTWPFTQIGVAAFARWATTGKPSSRTMIWR